MGTMAVAQRKPSVLAFPAGAGGQASQARLGIGMGSVAMAGASGNTVIAQASAAAIRLTRRLPSRPFACGVEARADRRRLCSVNRPLQVVRVCPDRLGNPGVGVVHVRVTPKTRNLLTIKALST